MRKEVNYLIQIVESILQFRLDKNKNILQHLSFVRNQIRKSYKFQTYDETILTSLVPQQSYEVRSKICSLGYGKLTSLNEDLSLRLRFKAIEKSTSQEVNEENWLFMLRGSSENPFSDKKTSSWALLDLVDHIIRHLIYFELTPQKKDRKSSKSKYLVDYIIQIGKPKEYEENLLLKKNLWQKKVYSKGQKTNEAFSIQATCFYKDHSIGNYIKSNSSSSNKTSSHKNSQEQTSIGTRRVSLFEIYDEDLEMIMLSGNNSIKNEKKISEICLQVDEEEQFQMLIEQTRTEDQIFLEQNTGLLKEIAFLQDQHFYQ